VEENRSNCEGASGASEDRHAIPPRPPARCLVNTIERWLVIERAELTRRTGASQSIDQSINQSINQPINQSINQTRANPSFGDHPFDAEPSRLPNQRLLRPPDTFATPGRRRAVARRNALTTARNMVKKKSHVRMYLGQG